MVLLLWQVGLIANVKLHFYLFKAAVLPLHPPSKVRVDV